MAGKVVYGFRGACTFATKAKYAQEAGAEALILVNNLGGGYMVIVADDEELAKRIHIPIGSLPIGLGYQLKGIVEGGS